MSCFLEILKYSCLVFYIAYLIESQQSRFLENRVAGFFMGLLPCKPVPAFDTPGKARHVLVQFGTGYLRINASGVYALVSQHLADRLNGYAH